VTCANPGRPKERIAVAQGEAWPTSEAGIHQDRSRLAVGAWEKRVCLELQELSVEIEIASFGPRLVDHIEPFWAKA
jgi:hypothetical protein